jgi:hypothetical protein
MIYNGIRLSLHCHRRKEYIEAAFKSCWKDSEEMVPGGQARLVVVGEQTSVPPPPPKLEAKRGEPKESPRLAALIKMVDELHQVGLKACHCVEEFTLW